MCTSLQGAKYNSSHDHTRRHFKWLPQHTSGGSMDGKLCSDDESTLGTVTLVRAGRKEAALGLHVRTD